MTGEVVTPPVNYDLSTTPEQTPRPPETPHILSIIHLTDLHLLFNERSEPATGADFAARMKAFRSLSKPIPPFRRVVEDGLAVADKPSYRWLISAFRRAYHVERSHGPDHPIFVAHTGDVDAHGMIFNQDHRGYGWLEANLSEASGEKTAWFDVYGNHDIWSQDWPLDVSRLNGGSTIMRADLARFADVWPNLERLEQAPLGNAIEVYRLNSVLESYVKGSLLALGKLGPHPRMGTRREERVALRRLTRHLRWDSLTGALRIVLSHHPPFRPLSGGVSAQNGDELADVAQGLHLLLAGHTHRLDSQVTARGGFGQLVAESPTQAAAELVEEERRSLSVYRVRLDQGNDELSVGRLRYTNILGRDGPPPVEVEVLAGLAFSR